MLRLRIQEGNVRLSYTHPKERLLPDYAIFILRFVLFAATHSLFATDRVKRAFAGAGAGEPRPYRLIYNLASVVLFAWVMSAYRNSPLLYFAPGIWSLVMYLLQLVVAAVLIGCLRQTGIADFLGISRIRRGDSEPPRLVTGGCYGMVRHPLYLFATIFLCLNPVMTAQWLLLTILSVIYFVCGALIEEKRLERQFGDEFRRYRAAVPFIIPVKKRFRLPPSA